MTVREGEGDTRDTTLLEKLPPQLHVVRTPYLRFSAWENKSARVLKNAQSSAGRSQNAAPSPLQGHLRSLARFVRSYLYFPDNRVGWIPFGFAAAVDLVFRKRFDLIYTSSLPGSTAVLGLLLKQTFGIPWVAEFRDPLFLPDEVLRSLNMPEPTPTRKKIENWLHARILRNADTLLTVTDGYAQELKSSYHVPPEKVAVVTNGFDEVDFGVAPNGDCDFFPKGYVHLTHLGTIYPYFSAKFFPALLELVQESPEVKQRLRLNIIGYPDGEVLRYTQEKELKDIVTVQGFINQKDAFRAMRSSDYLLVFYGHRYISRVCVPGKIYDFVRVGRPVFAITYDGGLKSLIEKGEAGRTVDPEDKQAIKAALRDILQGRSKVGPPTPSRPEFVEQFRYDRLAGKLAQVLDAAVTHGS
jgi:glycosyltransferase involved in cell wall biosynthesis